MSVRFHFSAAAILYCCIASAADAQSIPRADSLAAISIATKALKDYFGTLDLVRGTASYGHIERDPKKAIYFTAWTRAIQGLDSASRLSPRDQDILAIRVYHNIIRGYYKDAEKVVLESCRTDEWLCSALLGFARHNDSRFAEAERDYSLALDHMPPDKRCLWDDISEIMNDAVFVKYYRQFSCDQRAELNARIWRLSQPLWIEAGNDRRTEHYSRWMTADIVRRQVALLGWRNFDTEKMSDPLLTILRVHRLQWYGGLNVGCANAKYARLDCRSTLFGPNVDNRFIPVFAAALAPYSGGIFDFALAPQVAGLFARAHADTPIPLWTRNSIAGSAVMSRGDPELGGFGETFATRYGRVYTIRDAQVALLLRGSQSKVLATFDAREVGLPNAFSSGIPLPNGSVTGSYLCRRDDQGWCPTVGPWRTMIRTTPLRVGIAVSNSFNDSVHVTTGTTATAAPVRLSMLAGFDSALISLEARTIAAAEYAVSARHRFAVFRPDLNVTSRIKLSDVVLYDASTGAQPKSEKDVLTLMLPRSTVTTTEQVGLYWEVYGMREGEIPEFEIAVAPVDSGRFLRSVARTLGLVSSRGTALVRWKGDAVTTSSIGSFTETAHSTKVSLRALKPGTYALELTARVPGDSAVRISRLVKIR